jgi:hypothetical protein
LKTAVGLLGKLVFIVAAFAFFILDLYSLVLLAEKYGLLSALIAFIIVPAQILVPFLVGTWIPMLLLLIIGFGGFVVSDSLPR